MIEVNENGFVSARELHKVLEVVGRFQRWFDSSVEYGFDLGLDFNMYTDVQVQKEGIRYVKRNIKDYWVTIDMAKEITMISNVPKSKEVRKYR